MSVFKKQQPEPEDRQKERRRRLLTLLGLYLEDLLLISGCVCFTAAAALRWGAAGGLAVCGVCLTAFSVLIARAGRR